MDASRPPRSEGSSLIGLGLQSWRQAHYAAPGAGLALLVTMRAIHRVAGWGPRRIRLGRSLAQALWIVAMMTLTVGWRHSFTSKRPAGWQDERARIAARLGRAGDKHLVLVRYAAGHHARAQWVYNAADIDAAPSCGRTRWTPPRTRVSSSTSGIVGYGSSSPMSPRFASSRISSPRHPSPRVHERTERPQVAHAGRRAAIGVPRRLGPPRRAATLFGA